MSRWICEQCGEGFNREKSGKRPIRFCTVGCYHAWRSAHGVTTGQFKTGHMTWNKGVKGLRMSPGTEFKKGQRARNWVPVGSETERNDKSGRRRGYVKIGEPNKWRERAIVVWERHHGRKLPRGHVVHHRDRNSLNDSPDNLEALTRAAHLNEHRHEFQSPKPKQEAMPL